MPARQGSVQFQCDPQKFLHRLRGCCGRRRVVAHMGAALDARVFHGERLLGHGINDRALWLLLQRAAPRGLCIGRQLWTFFEDGIVEGVMGVGKLGQRHVFACLTQALDIGSARCDRNIIVRGAVKETDGLLAHIRIVDVGREARRVEGQIGGKRRAFRGMHALEAIEAA